MTMTTGYMPLFIANTLSSAAMKNWMMKMKQRALTDIQMTVLKMHMAGRSNDAIALEVGIHPATVSCKMRDIRKGISKGAYNNLPHDLNATGDLFGD